MTIENIKDRNIKILSNLIKHYKIKFTADELINNFRTVYLHKIDSEISEIRVQGAQTIYTEHERNGVLNRIPSKKTLNTAIYTLRKKAIIIHNIEAREEIAHAMKALVYIIQEMGQIKELETFEEKFEASSYGCYLDWSE